MKEVTVGIEKYQAEVIVRLIDKDGKTQDIVTELNPDFVLSLPGYYAREKEPTK